jgi:hypothetical protein
MIRRRAWRSEMPKFYFNVCDGAAISDIEECELSDINAAQHEAVKKFGQMICELRPIFRTDAEWKMDVMDGRGSIVFSLRFLATNAPVTFI